MAFDVAVIVQVREVAFAPPGQIVDHPDRVTASEQDINHVTADEACSARDDSDRLLGHAALSLFSRRTLKY